MGEFVEVMPPMKRVHEIGTSVTADAVYQNFESVEVERP
jgi:glucose-1-phosphate adenylyltransferase